MKLSYAYHHEGRAAWQPARPGDTPGQLVPGEADVPQPIQASARRERLAELDALTDRIGPLLDRLESTWAAVETHLAQHRRSR